MEAMEKLKGGQKFNEVATAYSEDKARQGVSVVHKSVCVRLAQLARSQPEYPGFNFWPGQGLNFGPPFFAMVSVDRDVTGTTELNFESGGADKLLKVEGRGGGLKTLFFSNSIIFNNVGRAIAPHPPPPPSLCNPCIKLLDLCKNSDTS